MEFVTRPVPQVADLDAILSVMTDTGNSCCWDYPRIGLRILGSRDISMEQFMDDLRTEHFGHWVVGMRSLGVMGRSQDVSRTHNLPAQCPELEPQFDGSIVDLAAKSPLAERPDGSGCSFLLTEHLPQ